MRILYLPNAYSQQRQREKKANIYPVRLASEAEWYRKQGHEVSWGSAIGKYDKIISEAEGLPFLSLPHPDRVFTRAKEFTSGNYKYLPGTHIMSASGCWWGKCSFCVESRLGKLYTPRLLDTQNSVTLVYDEEYTTKPYEVRGVEDCIEEIKEIQTLGYKEIFDDSGTFPTGRWLDEFCFRFKRYRNIRFSCNMRLDGNCDFNYLRSVGFRMLLFGVESASQFTLDRINKGVKVENIIPTIKKASEAGLEPHISVIFGWEWETNADALNTLRLVHYLLRKGYAKTAQASFICQQDIKGNESQRHFIREIYGVWKYPDFWWNQLKDIKDKDDLKYLWRKIKEGLQWHKPH